MSVGFADLGIVVGSIDYRDSDRVVSILTRDHGLNRYFARGVRKQGSKKGPHLDLLQHISFQTQNQDDPIFLLQVETMDPFLTIKSSYNKIKLCLAISEVLNNILALGVLDKEVYLSFLNYLKGINSSVDDSFDQRLTTNFSLYLLKHLGYPVPRTSSSKTIRDYFELVMNRKLTAIK